MHFLIRPILDPKFPLMLHSPIEWHEPLYLVKWEHIPQSHHYGHALTSDHVRLHLTIISERPSVLDQVLLVTHQEAPFQEWQYPLYLIM